MKLVFTFIILMAITGNLYAHGMDKPGPNGGFVKMPGAFHTEVIPADDGSLQIYLLDVEIKNPTVTNATVSAEVKDGDKVIKFKCPPMAGTHFHCITGQDSKVALQRGKLHVQAKRGDLSGEAIYELPFKLSELSKPATDHASHH